MKIIKSQIGGFCVGVDRAVKLARQQKGKNFCVLGRLIHNQKIIDDLALEGIVCVDSLADCLKYDGVIIRSHGEPKSTYDFLNAHNKEIIDATCAFVSKIHRIVEQHYNDGFQIIIVGDSHHAEVKGINGWCQSSAIVLEDVEGTDGIDFSKKLCIVAQTTYSHEKYSIFLKNIGKLNLKTVEVFDTICYTTFARQQEAEKIAKQSTKVLVLGGKNSSNTLKLFQVCKRFCQAYLIESVSELSNIKFNKTDTVGLVAGASTPNELILEVYFYMSEKQSTKLETAVEQVETTAQAVPTTEPVAQEQHATEAQAETPVATPKEPKEKKEKAPKSDDKKQKLSEDSKLFREEMGKKPVPLKIGKRYKVEILSVDDKGIYVALDNNKRDGFIASEDAGLEEFKPSDYKAGDKIYAILKSLGDKATGCHRLSKKEVDIERKNEAEAAKAIDPIRDGSEFSLVMTDENKGGLVGNLAHYRVFVPASQIREGFPKNLKQFIGKSLRLTALEIDDKKHRIVASQKKILAEERKLREEAFWSNIEVNQIVEGKVMRATSFGAFVDVNGFDCLAHIGDLSWVRISKVEEVLKIGESYDFVVLAADRAKNKISLGFKQLNKHPFDLAVEKYPVGSTVKGRVVRLVSFGAFVQIEHGVDALLHLSEASHSFTKNINEIVKVGDEIEAMVTKIDHDDRKISLSIKALQPEPVAEEMHDRSESAVDVLEVEGTAQRPKKEFKRPVNSERKKPSKLDPKDDGPREWSEDNTNNPFAILLKDIEIEKK